MNLKVCGVTELEQLVQLDKLLVDFAGFVFNSSSYQNVRGRIEPSALKYADVELKKVGVFTNESIEEILRVVVDYGLDLVQLNGQESPEVCRALSSEISVIKTFYIDHFDADRIGRILSDYDSACDFYSFDSNLKTNRGGITQAFDWKMIGNTSIEKPFFIGGGGIRPSDAPLIHGFKHPDFFGVDINQYFEKEPGIKDTSLVLSFMRAVNQVVN